MNSIWMSVVIINIDSAQIRYYSNVLGKPHLLCPRSCWRWSGCRLELAEQTRRWASQSFEITVFNRFKGQFTIFNWQGVGEEVGRETAEGSGQAREISYFSREQKQTTIFYFSRERNQKKIFYFPREREKRISCAEWLVWGVTRASSPSPGWKTISSQSCGGFALPAKTSFMRENW